MYQIKLTSLSSATNIAADDIIEVVDINDFAMGNSGTNKKTTVQLLANSVAKIISDGAIISATNNDPALRITQNGLGHAFVVADNPSPDSSQFIITTSGTTIIGALDTQSLDNIYTTGQLTPKLQIQGNTSDEASLAIFQCQENGAGGVFHFARSRGSIGARLPLQNGDTIGATSYQVYDGTQYIEAARITASVDSAIAANDVNSAIIFSTNPPGSTGLSERMRISSAGNIGIGQSSPTYKLHLGTDSAAKPSTSTWTISSDERLKENIEAADLDVCYNAVKSIPLKRYRWKDEIYSTEQVPDRSKIGWIAQDVKNIFPKAVSEQKFVYNQIRDEDGIVVSEDAIEDCLSLNSDQIYAALFGAVQKLIKKVEDLESIIEELQNN